MTKLELRILQLISRQGGEVAHRHLTPHLSRYPATERDQALRSLVLLGLVQSLEVQAIAAAGHRLGGKKGGKGVVHSLTPAGQAWVAEARAEGKIKDRVV